MKNKEQIYNAMHSRTQYACANICERMFTIYTSDVQPCLDYIGNRCYRKFFGGQMEHVLDDCVSIAYIRTPRELVEVVRELRKIGVHSALQICVEYIDGCPVLFTTV